MAESEVAPAAPIPSALIAVTRNTYGTPFVSPESVAAVALLVVSAIPVVQELGDAAGAYSTL